MSKLIHGGVYIDHRDLSVGPGSVQTAQARKSRETVELRRYQAALKQGGKRADKLLRRFSWEGQAK